MYRELEEHTKTVGLAINAMNLGRNIKTKVMTQSRKDFSCQHTDIQDIEVVDSSIYRGT
jgi:hypothetical protein